MAYTAMTQDGVVYGVYRAPDDLENPSYEDDTRTVDERMTEYFNALGKPGAGYQTSFNASIRGRFAGIGDAYDADLDVFIIPQPFPSWSLDETGNWQAPIAYPEDGEDYVWDEEYQDWIAL